MYAVLLAKISQNYTIRFESWIDCDVTLTVLQDKRNTGTGF